MNDIQPDDAPRERPRSVYVRIHGKVQGVFYRASLKRVCDEAGVKGWVRNNSDGTVEALLQGKSETIGEILDWCNNGPEGASVSSVEFRDSEPDSNLRVFEIVY